MITRVGKLTWRVRPDFEALRPVLEDPERFLQDPVIWYKRSPNITVVKINFDGPNCPGLVLRRLNYGKFLHRLRDFFRRSRAERAMRWGLLLGQVGIATPRPLAAANVRCCRWPLTAYLITEEVPGAKTLTRFVKEKPLYSENVLLRLADLIAALHNAGYSHRDLKATNVLLDDQLKPWLIDLDGIRRLDRFGRSRAAADLERLARNFNAAFLRRAGPPFLRRYCQRRHDHPSPLQLFRKLSAALRRSN